MVFTVVNSIQFTFRKYEKHENGLLPHYDSFRGGGSHMYFWQNKQGCRQKEVPKKSILFLRLVSLLGMGEGRGLIERRRE